MARTAIFQRFIRLIAAVRPRRDHAPLSYVDTIETLAHLTHRSVTQTATRREFLRHTGAAGIASLGLLSGAIGRAGAAPFTQGRRRCRHCWSWTRRIGLCGRAQAERRDRFPVRSGNKGRRALLVVAQLLPRSGRRTRRKKLIDNLHKTMLGYAQRFGLAKEDVNKVPGEVFYHFYGQRYPEAAVVTEFRDFVSAMRVDLNRLSREITATSHTQTDEVLDQTNLMAYLEGANGAQTPAGPLVKAAIIEAYEAEYGLAADEQSCLNFLLFIHADRRSKFTPLGVFSDERYHLLDGNDGIVAGLAAELSERIGLRRLARTHAAHRHRTHRTDLARGKPDHPQKRTTSSWSRSPSACCVTSNLTPT